MPELVIVLVVLAVVAVAVVPKFDLALGFRQDAWRDQVVAALRHAKGSAVAHRRLVCVTVGSTAVTLTIASANPATSCNANLTGPDGSAVFASTANSSLAVSVSPSGVIYFQPDGRATSDGAGNSPSSRTLSISGLADITVNGETGYVE